VLAVLAYICVRALVSRHTFKPPAQRNLYSFGFGLGFVLVVFLLGSLSFMVQLSSFLDAFVFNRMFPDGPTAYIDFTAAGVASQTANICGAITPVFSDGILVSLLMSLLLFDVWC
jgi:hypothetical protein